MESQVFSQPSYPQQPPHKRQRVAAPLMARTHKRHGRKPYAKTGKGNKRQGSLRGKSFGAKHVTPFVHRSVFPGGNGVLWPFVNPGPGQTLNTLRVLVPEQTWGRYTRGFDINQVTQNGIRSRNVSMRVTIKLPTAAVSPIPFRLRIVQCWVKSPMVGFQQNSTQGVSGMSDGIVLNYNALTAIENHCQQVMADSVGTVNGDGNVTGNISTDRIQIINDRTMTMASTNVDSNGAFVYPTFTQTYNFKTQQNMRLLPTTSGAAVPQDPDNIFLCPLNNPLQWTPCIAMMIMNGGSYTGPADQPRVFMTESHYWTCN